MRKAVVKQANGYVENVIEIKNGANWQPPSGYILIDALNGSPGDTWNGSSFIKPTPIIEEPPRSAHVSILEGIDPTKARPARIRRVWQGRDYYYDCFATQTVKDEFQAGKIVIGDHVIVHFDEVGEQIVTAKVFKSW